MAAIDFLGYVLFSMFFILTPIGLIGLAYVAISEFLEIFKPK
jgi:hypothetical protein